MPQIDLQFETASKFVSEIEGLEHIELQGEGEPLMYSRFFDLLALARARFPALKVSIITNGSLLNNEHIDLLLDHAVNNLYVSIESADDLRFQEIRGGKLDRVKRGLRALLDARNSRGLSTPSVGFAVTLLRSTLSACVENIGPLYQALGMDGGVMIQPLQGLPQFVRHYDAAMRTEECSGADVKQFHESMRTSESVRHMLEDRHRHPGFYDRLYASVAGRNACPWLENGAYLCANGEVVPCAFVKDSDTHSLGGVADGAPSIMERRLQLADQLAAGTIPPSCTGCDIARQIQTRVLARAATKALARSTSASTS